MRPRAWCPPSLFDSVLMEPAEFRWWLDFFTFLGIAILAVPVWSLNTRRKKLKAIQDALPDAPQSFRERVRQILKDKRGRDVADWRRVDELCLIFGYGFLLGSSVLRLFLPTGITL